MRQPGNTAVGEDVGLAAARDVRAWCKRALNRARASCRTTDSACGARVAASARHCSASEGTWAAAVCKPPMQVHDAAKRIRRLMMIHRGLARAACKPPISFTIAHRSSCRLKEPAGSSNADRENFANGMPIAFCPYPGYQILRGSSSARSYSHAASINFSRSYCGRHPSKNLALLLSSQVRWLSVLISTPGKPLVA